MCGIGQKGGRISQRLGMFLCKDRAHDTFENEIEMRPPRDIASTALWTVHSISSFEVGCAFKSARLTLEFQFLLPIHVLLSFLVGVYCKSRQEVG